jgi:hypothetical protein
MAVGSAKTTHLSPRVLGLVVILILRAPYAFAVDKQNSPVIAASELPEVTLHTDADFRSGPKPNADNGQVDDALLEREVEPTTEAVQPPAHVNNLARRQDERRPEDQFQMLLFDRPLTIGGKYELSPEHRANYDLEDDGDRDLTRVNQEFNLELLYVYSPSMAAFIETQVVYTRDDRGDGEDDSEFDIRRGQSWIHYTFWPEAGLSLQIGRQNLQEKRSWWWDADLDTVRLHFDRGAVHAELGLAEEVFPVSIDDEIPAEFEDVTRVFGRWHWEWASRQQLEFFWLSERDRSDAFQENVVVPEDLVDEIDAELDWFGARALGKWKTKPIGTLYYWADIASVRGNEHLTSFTDAGDGSIAVDGTHRIDVHGWAVDAGLTLRTKGPQRLSFTAGYAVGSGNDQPDNDTDRAFRQTGLNLNKGKFQGVARFRYYGELFRPELSNLSVITFAMGRRFFSASSIDLIYHNYRQVHAQPFMRSARIKAPLSGEDSDVGDEIDLVIGVEEWRHWELTLMGSIFLSGDAYGPSSGEKAYRADLQLKYIF